jgi:sec-independent protein translocase protein TatA
MGQSARVFKGEMKAMKEDDASAVPAAPAVPADTTTTVAQTADPSVSPDSKP